MDCQRALGAMLSAHNAKGAFQANVDAVPVSALMPEDAVRAQEFDALNRMAVDRFRDACFRGAFAREAEGDDPAVNRFKLIELDGWRRRSARSRKGKRGRR